MSADRHAHRPRLPTALAATALALAASALPCRAAGTFTVTTTADTGLGSLRQAITDANAAAGGTINVTTAGLLTLTAPLPIITTPITLNGNNLVINGDDKYRPFFIDAPVGAAVMLNNLTLFHGRAKE